LNKNFQIYRSSAGSGKTYTLSLSFIALALKGDNFGYKDYYRKILAITFTNKAASEMKERVLEYLNSLANEKDNDGILLWLVEETKLTEVEIYKRAGIIHKHILHNYADLGISTIDKFTYKIVRTFASDLGLSHNFDLEMDTYKIIQPVVALLLTKMSNTGGDLSDALVNFAMQKAEDGKSTNIERDLEIFSQELFKEEVAKYVDGELLSVSDCMLLKKDLQKTKNDIALKVEKLADKVCIFFDTNGFTKEHFNRGTFYTHFTKNIADDDKKWMPSDALIRYTANGEWYTKSKKQEIKDLVDSFIPQLEQFFIDLMDLLTEYNSVNAVLKNIYSIAVLNELMIEVRNFKNENNIEQISEFNKKIHNVVTKQPSSFIYERLGERYNHYLIDEFQDTSLLQWQNILPLVTDSLDNGKSMVVGDGKQSIYRWRGGEVEQFFKLPEIYKGDDLLFKQDWESKLAYHENVKNLKSNFRSRKNIIEFNNQFFENTKTLLSHDIVGIYDKAEQESKQAQDGGYVHIELLGDKENDATILILEKLVAEIKKLKEKNKEASIRIKTGLFIDPYFSATKIKWIIDNVPQAKKLIKQKKLLFGTIDTFLIWKLTSGKVHATGATNASRTLLFNINSNKWDNEILNLFKVPKNILPEVKNSADNFGVTNKSITGTPIPINGVVGDQQAATIGQCCFSPGSVKSTYGTGAFVLMNTGSKKIFSKNKLLTTICYRINNKTTYALEGSIFIAGAGVQWLRDKIKLINNAHETEKIAKSKKNNNGVYLVPAFTGLGAPYWSPNSRGVLSGLTRSTDWQNIVRAVLESVAYQSFDLFKAMNNDGLKPKVVKVDGGMVSNNWFSQFLSDILNIKVIRPKINETTALGAAFMAGLYIGEFNSFKSISKKWKIDKRFNPNIDKLSRIKLLKGWEQAIKRTLI